MSKRAFDSPILEVRGLCIAAHTPVSTTKAALLVDHVSFTVARGEILGLIGQSGAGKSTLGLAALGYLRTGCYRTAGQVFFDGRDVFMMGAGARRALRGRKIAYIAQSAASSFNPAMRLIDQVSEAPLRHGLMTATQAREAAIALFDALELPDPEKFGLRYPHQVSGGQLQRAMAAMAMMTKPDLLVFDEPTTALDVTTQAEVLSVFRKLIRQQGASALYISHDLAVVAQMADRILVLRDGETVEMGAVEDMLSAPREDYTRRLVTTRNAGARAAVMPSAAPTPPVLLAVDNVMAGYASTPRAIDHVSLEIRHGETFAIVGESGSGKSTLARAIAGLLPAKSGALFLSGAPLPTDFAARTRQDLRQIQMVAQAPDTALNPRQTLLEIIGRPMALYFGYSVAEIRARVAALLAEIGLPEHFMTRLPGQLSGGQKQRVCIARALAAEPSLIICDEVTAALDSVVAGDILALLRRIQQKRGIAYLFISHDLGIVQRIADRVAVMLKGKMVASGAVADVFTPPCHPYTQKLLAAVPEMRVGWLDDFLQAKNLAAG